MTLLYDPDDPNIIILYSNVSIICCCRHSVYKTQYRAIFVLSCKVDYSHLLSFPTKLTKKEKWKSIKKERQQRRKRNGTTESPDDVGLASAPVKRVRFSDIDPDDCMANNADNSAHNEEMDANNSVADKDKNHIILPPGSITDKTTGHTSTSTENNISDDTETKNTKVNEFTIKVSNTNNDASTRKLTPKSCRGSVEAKTATGAIGNCSSTSAGTGDERYYSVTCEHCNTKVAVMDTDEVYHFFNVVTSY